MMTIMLEHFFSNRNKGECKPNNLRCKIVRGIKICAVVNFVTQSRKMIIKVIFEL